MALVKADGTAVAKAPGGTVLETVTPDPAEALIRVKINVYEVTPYDNVDYPTQMKQLAFREGQVIKQKEWDAKFAAPTIASIAPATGPAAGGTTVTILGTGFTSDATVTFDGASATGVDVDNAGELTCVTPAGSAGTADVVVTQTGGTATEAAGYTYTT